MQNRIISAHNLLDENGRLTESGWSDSELLKYNPRCIKLNRISMKEWDSYIIFSSSGEYALSLIFADKRLTGFIGACFYNIKAKTSYECFAPKLLPSGKITLSDSVVSGSTVYKDSTTEIMFLVNGNERHLYCKCSPYIGDSIEANIHLGYDKNKPIISAASQSDDLQFTYNQKILNMPADGYVMVNGEVFKFNPQMDFAVLDWGRSVRTQDNIRYWCAGASEVSGKPFSFNVGYGLNSSFVLDENCVFYNNACHKIGRVFIDIPVDNTSDEWVIRSEDKRFEARITPLHDFEFNRSYGKISQTEKTMFGRMTAEVILDDGAKLSITDMLCFGERTRNKY